MVTIFKIRTSDVQKMLARLEVDETVITFNKIEYCIGRMVHNGAMHYYWEAVCKHTTNMALVK